MPSGIVGREAQLLEVERFVDASTGGFAVLVLEGDAGIGKTTLWREARGRARERGALVLTSRPSEAARIPCDRLLEAACAMANRTR